MPRDDGAPLLEELPVTAIRGVIAYLQARYGPATVTSPADLAKPIDLAFKAGQASVVTDLARALKRIEDGQEQDERTRNGG